LAATRLMTILVFGVTTTEPWIYAAVSLIFMVLAVAALLIPAHRAANVDPIVALRYE
jgi:ABC-type lipoprotein release transport system permease subunit